jgi:hypothetical protein
MNSRDRIAHMMLASDVMPPMKNYRDDPGYTIPPPPPGVNPLLMPDEEPGYTPDHPSRPELPMFRHELPPLPPPSQFPPQPPPLPYNPYFESVPHNYRDPMEVPAQSGDALAIRPEDVMQNYFDSGPRQEDL